MGDLVNFPGTPSGRAPTGGGTPPGLDSRVAKVEATVEHIQEDIKEIKGDVRAVGKKVDDHLKILAGMIIAAFLLLGGMIITGYLRITDKMETVNDRIEKVGQSVNAVMQRLPPPKK